MESIKELQHVLSQIAAILCRRIEKYVTGPQKTSETKNGKWNFSLTVSSYRGLILDFFYKYVRETEIPLQIVNSLAGGMRGRGGGITRLHHVQSWAPHGPPSGEGNRRGEQCRASGGEAGFPLATTVEGLPAKNTFFLKRDPLSA